MKSDSVGGLPPMSRSVTTITWYDSARYNTNNATQLFRHGVRTPLLRDINGSCRLQCRYHINNTHPKQVSPGQLRTTELSEVSHPLRKNNHVGGGKSRTGQFRKCVSSDKTNISSTVNTVRFTSELINSGGVGKYEPRSRGSYNISLEQDNMTEYRWRSSDYYTRDAADVLYRNTYLSDGNHRFKPRSWSLNERPWAPFNDVGHAATYYRHRLQNGVNRNEDKLYTNKRVHRRSQSLNIDDAMLNIKPIYRTDEMVGNESTRMMESARIRDEDRIGEHSISSADSSIYTHGDRSAQIYRIQKDGATTIEFQPIVIQRPLKQEKPQQYPHFKTHGKTPLFRGKQEQTKREFKSVEAYHRFLDSVRQNTPVSPTPSIPRSSRAPSDSYECAHEQNQMIQSVTEYNRPYPSLSSGAKVDEAANMPKELVNAGDRHIDIQPTVVPLRDVH